MGKVVPFQKKNDNNSETLYQWINFHHNEEELREVFLNMDRALKYIHDHDYCIEVFYPTEIQVLNNETDHIRFKKLIELPSDPEVRRQWITEDIFRSSLIQIGIYSNSLKYLTPDFLKENFDSFTQFIPSGDVPYYRGIVQRGASVYFCEYAVERRNRDLEELEKELGEDADKEKQLLKTPTNEDITNNRVNDVIYRQINGLKDAAFVNMLLIPTIVIGSVLVLAILAFLISTFN